METPSPKPAPGPAIESVEVPWSESLVLICTKCARKLGDESAADALKAALKAKAKDEGLAGKMRIVTSSCLNVCPAGRQALALARAGEQPVFRAFTVLPGLSADELYAQVKPA